MAFTWAVKSRLARLSFAHYPSVVVLPANSVARFPLFLCSFTVHLFVPQLGVYLLKTSIRPKLNLIFYIVGRVLTVSRLSIDLKCCILHSFVGILSKIIGNCLFGGFHLSTS